MEDDNNWHYRTPTMEELEKSKQEIQKLEKRVRCRSNTSCRYLPRISSVSRGHWEQVI